MTVSPEEFIRAWQTSSNYAEVIEKTGMKPGTICVRACAYRRKGIPLKYISKYGPRRKIAALIELAKSLADAVGETR